MSGLRRAPVDVVSVSQSSRSRWQCTSSNTIPEQDMPCLVCASAEMARMRLPSFVTISLRRTVHSDDRSFDCMTIRAAMSNTIDAWSLSAAAHTTSAPGSPSPKSK